MATAIWRGSITFGLASIPIRLYAAARPKRIALHQLHNKCHTRLKQPLFCPTCNRFVEPEAQGAKAYRLLLKALEDTNRMGVAKLTMHQREYTVFLRPRKHGMTLHTMFSSSEIATVAEYGKYEETKLNPQDVKLAEQLVQSLAAD